MPGAQNRRVFLLDIDGTLVHPGRKQMNGETMRELHKLQVQGVTLAFATGRNPAAARPAVLGEFIPDYYICVNGTYIVAGDGRVVYDHPLNQKQFDNIMGVAERERCSIGFAFPECYCMYSNEEPYLKRYREVHNDMEIFRYGTDCTRHLSGMPYGAFGIIPRDSVRAFQDPALGLQVVSFGQDSYDICQEGHTKATGAARLLEALGLDWCDLVAVGDGENDIELLEAAGLGVAMGNAPDHVKIYADAVTGTVLEDGVLQVIRAYF